MTRHLLVAALMTVGASSMFAQESHWPVSLGFKIGVPVTDMMSAKNTSEFNDSIPGSYSAHAPRYEFGVSGEFHLPHHVRFEVDGLVRRGGFDSALTESTGMVYRPTSFNEWEIPGLFKFNVLGGHYRPFVDVGPVYRHISTIAQMTYGIEPFGTLSNSSSALMNRNSFGGVAGFGLTLKRGAFELSPEARYTRWANQSFSAMGLHTNLDQGDVVLGITF